MIVVVFYKSIYIIYFYSHGLRLPRSPAHNQQTYPLTHSPAPPYPCLVNHHGWLHPATLAGSGCRALI